MESGGPEEREHSVELHGYQNDLFEELLRRDSSLARMYAGAVRTLDDALNPDRVAQCAHSLRELIEKLPGTVGIRVTTMYDLATEADKLEVALTEVRDGPAFVGGTWIGCVDDRLPSLVLSLETLVEQRRLQRGGRREATRAMLQELDPGRDVVPSPLGDIAVKEWMDARKYFTDSCHHRQERDDAEFRERVAAFEQLLLNHLRPLPFADFDEIDRILGETQ